MKASAHAQDDQGYAQKAQEKYVSLISDVRLENISPDAHLPQENRSEG